MIICDYCDKVIDEHKNPPDVHAGIIIACDECESSTDRLDKEIDKRKATKATGARKGIRMVAPVTKRKYIKTIKTPEQKARKAEAQRKYRATLSKDKKQAQQDKQNARRRAITKGQVYVYMPSIPQAKDRRRSGDLLEQYYAEITARIALSDSQLLGVAYSQDEMDIDIALQIARRPSGQTHPWEMLHLERPPMPPAGYSRLPGVDRSVQYVDKRRLTLADLQSK